MNAWHFRTSRQVREGVDEGLDVGVDGAGQIIAMHVALLCSSGDGPHLLGRDGISRELQRIYFLSRLPFFLSLAVGRFCHS